MRFWDWLFRRNSDLVQCPRCLGKGRVEWGDIKRLGMELRWMPGKCAYCNGVGKVSTEMETNVAVDETYLTVELSSRERLKLINKDPDAIMRAASRESYHEDVVAFVKHLYSVKKMGVEEIADLLIGTSYDRGGKDFQTGREDIVDYVKRVVGLK